MKKIALFASLLISTLAFAQDVNVPDAVINAFDEKYPDVEDVSWTKLKTNYQATFEEMETTMVQFTAEGKWIKTAIIVTEEDLPDLAVEHISENFDDTEITQVQMIENSKNEISYLVIMVIDDEKLKVKFDDEGLVIEK